MPERQFGTRRKTLPPVPPPATVTHATKMFDPRFGAPAAEGRQQLIVAQLRVTPARKHWQPPAGVPTEGIFAGKRLLIVAQSLENGANGRRLEAVQWFWPTRGAGAEDGSQRLSKLDLFFERVLGRIPRPGTFELASLVGLNFMATVKRARRKIGDEMHLAAYYHVTRPDCCPLYDDWPAYNPIYPSGLPVFHPEELADEKI